MDNPLESVVVAVRVRPLTEEECKENGFRIIQQLPEDPKVLTVAGKGFAFDHIFTEESEQVAVYEKAVRPAVEKLCAGFNCAVVAYGHTGTGKTYTIGTDLKQCLGVSSGIISRAVEDVLAVRSSEDRVEISFMEIYNEEVYDLLTPQSTRLHVQGFSVQSLTRVEVTGIEGAFHQLEVGSSNRHTRATNLNSHSSRSHAILSIYYQQKTSEGHTLTSRLDLVDLAGSEGVRHTGNKGLARVEAIKINQGLLNLRNVISILASNSKDFVPYRSSMLTTVLRDSLNRESFVTMITCISPAINDVEHTVMTLRFAEEAKKIMNRPKVNQIVEKFKNDNPQAFRNLSSVTSLIPPTPTSRNQYRSNHTPVSSFRKPLAQLNNLNTSSSSSSDLQESSWKAPMNTIMETPCNLSMLSLSNMSTSTRLDVSSAVSDVTSVLSPLLRKHLNMLRDELNSTLPRIENTPSQNHDTSMMTILSVTERTERNLRNELRSLKTELMSFVEDEIQKIQQADNMTGRNLRQNLSFSEEKKSHTGYCSGNSSPSPANCGGRYLTRRSAHFSKYRANVNDADHPGRVTRRSVRISRQLQAACANTPEDGQELKSFTNLTTVKRHPREEDCDKDCPDNTSTLRRSARLSYRSTNLNSADDICNMSTLKRRRGSLNLERTRREGSGTDDERTGNMSPVMTVMKKRRCFRNIVSRVEQPVFSPPETSVVRRSVRLSLKPRPVYDEGSLSPLTRAHRIRRQSARAVVAGTPGKVPSANARKKFQENVLKLLNGSLRDLTQLATVGPKTALIIYNYRCLTDCKFGKFEDLKKIPGLPSSYYERFLKANNIIVPDESVEH